MSPGEHTVIGQLLLTTVVAFFGLALPGYWLLRKFWPECGWNLGGSVPTSGFQKWDLLVLGGLTIYYLASWREMRGADAIHNDLTTGKIITSAFAYLGGAAILGMILARRVNLVEYFGLRWSRWLWIFLIVPAFLGVMFFFSAIIHQSGWVEAVQTRFGTQLQEGVQLLMKTNDQSLILVMIFTAVIAAPVAEEVIFRGYIYPLVKRYSEGWFAAIFSASLFAAVHMNLLGFPLFFIIGLAMVLLYEKTGSIWPCIICHMAFNGLNIGRIILMRFLGHDFVL